MCDNFRVDLAYDGSNFSGFQYQPDRRTVGGELIIAIQKLFRTEVKLVASGRTDTGVHAAHQVVNFKITSNIPERKVLNALRGFTPNDIHIQKVQRVDLSFSSRYSAKSRAYNYYFSTQIVPLWLEKRISKFGNIKSVCLKTDYQTILAGKKDFANFRKMGSNEKSTIREIKQVSLKQVLVKDLYSQDLIPIYCFHIEANSFLYGMVRNIMGALVEVFREKQDLGAFNQLFTGGPEIGYNYTSAKPEGLCLVKVNY